MKTSRLVPFVVAVAATLMVAGTAYGQQTRDVPIGSFVERITPRSSGGEWSVVLLSPTHTQPDTVGRLLWGCAGTGALVFGIRRPADATSYDQTQETVWTFDADPPRMAGIRRLTLSRSWGPGPEDAAAFTLRAKTAARLVIRLPAASPGRDAMYEYDLAGADSALDRLECVRNPRPVREAPDTFPSPAVPADEQTLTMAHVTELPRATNTPDFARALAAGYPASLREARVTGMVGVRFRVLEDGSVDPASITITSTDNEQFNEPTVRAVRILRFRPARVGNRPVKVWIELPIAWTTQR